MMRYYTSTNTDLQTIFSFDPSNYRSIKFIITMESNTYSSVNTLEILHDGISTSDIQYGVSIDNTTLPEIYTEVENYIVKIKNIPPFNQTNYIIEEQYNYANLYGEFTKSGSLLKQYTNGVAFDLYSSINNLTIRDESNTYNEFSNPNNYITSNSFFFVETGNNLISDWEINNHSDIIISNNIITSKSSGQQNSCIYQIITVTPGTVYKFDANTYYISSNDINAKINEYHTYEHGKLMVGNNIGNSKYLLFKPTNTEQNVNTQIIPTESEIYISFGYGELNSETVIKNTTFYEYVPFHLFKQTEGTLSIEWVEQESNVDIISFGDRKISLEGSNVVISGDCSLVAGEQQAGNNKIVYTYSNNLFSASLNNGSEVISNGNLITGVTNVNFCNSIINICYFPFTTSNTQDF